MPKVTRRTFMGAAAGSAAVALINPARIFSDTAGTALPPPSIEGDGSLMTALKKRKSIRAFKDTPIPDQTLSNLLWAAFGVNRPETGYRTAPSPKNSQEIDIYLTKPDGLYLYDPFFHQLVQIFQDDIRGLCGIQEFVSTAPVNLIYVADFSRLGNRGEDKKMFYAAADTGFISQNVYLFCAAFGLGTVVRDWIDRKTLSRRMKLKDDQRIILAQTVGVPA